MTACPKTRVENAKYRKAFRNRNCIRCGNQGAVGHHLRHQRLRDDHTVALCGTCHADLHAAANEAVWWAQCVPDLVMLGLDMWAEADYEMEKETV